MSLNSTDIAQIAHLARLQFTEDSSEHSIQADLSRIMKMIDQINEINTEGIEPLAHSLELAQKLRADVVSETNQRDLFQSIAPLTEAGLYLVPKVIS